MFSSHPSISNKGRWKNDWRLFVPKLPGHPSTNMHQSRQFSLQSFFYPEYPHHSPIDNLGIPYTVPKGADHEYGNNKGRWSMGWRLFVPQTTCASLNKHSLISPSFILRLPTSFTHTVPDILEFFFIVPLSILDANIKSAVHLGWYRTMSITVLNYAFIDPIRCHLGSTAAWSLRVIYAMSWYMQTQRVYTILGNLMHF